MALEKTILVALSYLGPLQLYCRYFGPSLIQIEQNDTYQKQSYRNRCDIYGANGKLSLCIPVSHETGVRLKVKETRIDYATDWRRLHWKGIESAYNSSPYFEFYRDIFEPYYQKEFVFLIDFCLNLNDEVLKIINIQIKPGLTHEFAFPGDIKNGSDLRALIHPKVNIDKDKGFRIIEYSQVFSQNHGFIPNLSILDLIFNMGPESGRVLHSSLL
jgi:hypothetical protein